MAPSKRDFSRPIRVDLEYRQALEALFEKLFVVPITASLGDIAARMMDMQRSGEVVRLAAESIASKMVAQVAVYNARSWREAAAQSHRGREIYRMLQNELRGPVGARRRELIAANALLIRSLPVEVAVQANSYIAEQQLRGERSSTIARTLRERLPQMKKTRIDLIARTEVSKADTALTRARAEEINLPAYVWETSEDTRVRKSHDHMQGVIVFWADPPAPEALVGERSRLGHYHAGNAPNCRCPALPLVDLSEVSWPAKVYRNGQITRMTQKAFLATLAQVQGRAA